MQFLKEAMIKVVQLIAESKGRRDFVIFVFCIEERFERIYEVLVLVL